MITQEMQKLKAELSEAEEELVKGREKVAELRHQLAGAEADNYTFKDIDGNDATLSSLFGDKQDLILVHNMGKECPYCTLWADGFNGVHQHLEDRAGFVVASPNDPATVKKFAEGRSWKFKMVSVKESSFSRDMGYESEKGNPMPGVSTFHKDENGKIVRVGTAPFGPGDEFCGVWPLFDLLKNGPDGWEPKYSY